MKFIMCLILDPPPNKPKKGTKSTALHKDFDQEKSHKKRTGIWEIQKEEKVHCLQGANPVLPQGEGPP